MRLLLVEDSARLRSLVSELVRAAGWRIDTVGGIGSAETAIASISYDLILLDLSLPDGDGVSFIRSMRTARNTTPIIVLSARNAIDDRIGALDAGADDYLTKPFNSRELLARARAMMRRAPLSAQPVIEAGALRFDPADALVTCANERLALTPRERAALEILMRSVGHVVVTQRLETALSQFAEEMSRNAIELVVSRLRRKLAPFPTGVAIETIRSVGYLLRETT